MPVQTLPFFVFTIYIPPDSMHLTNAGTDFTEGNHLKKTPNKAMKMVKSPLVRVFIILILSQT